MPGLGLGLGLSRGGGVRAAWTPADLTGLAADLLIAEARAAGKLWQDTAKTIPAVADGDPVRVAQGRYVSMEWAAPSDAARPLLYDDGGGKWSLEFDGVDDRLDVVIDGSALLTPWAAARVRLGSGSQLSARLVTCTVAGGPDTDPAALIPMLRNGLTAEITSFAGSTGPVTSGGAYDTYSTLESWWTGTTRTVARDGTAATPAASVLSGRVPTSLHVGSRPTSAFAAVSGRFAGVVFSRTYESDQQSKLRDYLGAL